MEESNAWKFIKRTTPLVTPVGQRRGQFLFNELEKEFPTVADEIRGTLYDPFYDNMRITAFHRRIIELMDY